MPPAEAPAAASRTGVLPAKFSLQVIHCAATGTAQPGRILEGQQDRDHSLWLGAHAWAKFYVLRHVVAGPDGLHFLPSRVIRMTTVRRCRPIADDLPAVICLPSLRASYEPLDQDELGSIDQPDQPC